MNELEIRQFIINLINSLIDRNNVKISKINLNKKFSQLGMDSLQMASFEYNVKHVFFYFLIILLSRCIKLSVVYFGKFFTYVYFFH